MCVGGGVQKEVEADSVCGGGGLAVRGVWGGFPSHPRPLVHPVA